MTRISALTSDVRMQTASIRAHCWRSASFFSAMVGTVFVLGFTWAWSKAIGFVLLMIVFPMVAVALLLTGIVFTIQGIKLAFAWPMSPRKRVMASLAVPAMFALGLAVAWHARVGGIVAGTAARLAVNQGQYLAIVETERQQARRRTSGFQEAAGVTYVVDHGPPLRVAFNPEGMLDNWSGIIFDPTHEVMRADGFDRSGRFRAPERITKLFGGDLVSCRHLWGDFFHCGFT